MQSIQVRIGFELAELQLAGIHELEQAGRARHGTRTGLFCLVVGQCLARVCAASAGFNLIYHEPQGLSED